MEPIRIVLAGMTAVQSTLVATSLESEPGLRVVEVVSTAGVLAAVREHEADLVIMPVPAGESIELVSNLERDCPSVRVLLLNRTQVPAAVDVYELRRISRDTSRTQLRSAIDRLIHEQRDERVNPLDR